MLDNVMNYIMCFGWLPLLLSGLLGLLLGWLLWSLFGKKHKGDLTLEGEGALAAENDRLRARITEFEGRVSERDTEVSSLKSKLAAAAAGAAAAGAATAAAKSGGDDDETYALEWRNRYLAARVKYLEGRIAEAPKKKAAPKKKTVAKKKPAAKPKAKAKGPKLYKKPLANKKPDDLKLIKGIGPKFEKDLNGKGIYYFEQIASWTNKDSEAINKMIDFPGRVQRENWVPQAKGLKGSGKAKPAKKAKAAPKKTAAKKKAAPKAKAVKSSSDVMFEKYFPKVQKYDPKARPAVVRNIINYCGVSLRSRDASLVACSDETELKRVEKNFCAKKLGLTGDQSELVKSVCQEMKADRFKDRVTFYYLTAKKSRKLGAFTK